MNTRLVVIALLAVLLASGCAPRNGNREQPGQITDKSLTADIDGYWLSVEDETDPNYQDWQDLFFVRNGQLGFVQQYSDGVTEDRLLGRLSSKVKNHYRYTPDSPRATKGRERTLTLQTDGSLLWLNTASGRIVNQIRLKRVNREEGLNLPNSVEAFRSKQDYAFARNWCAKEAFLAPTEKQMVAMILKEASFLLEINKLTVAQVISDRKANKGETITECEAMEDVIERGVEYAQGSGLPEAYDALHLSSSPTESLEPLKSLEVFGLELDATAMKDLSGIAEMKQLRTLSLRNLKLGNDEEAYSVLAKLPRLASLSLGNADLQNLYILGKLEGLKSLAISNDAGKELRGTALIPVRFPRLRSLNIYGYPDLDLSGFAETGYPLQVLTADISASALPPKLLEKLSTLHAKVETSEDLSAISKLTALRDLSISRKLVQLEEVDFLRTFSKLEKLSLNLQGEFADIDLISQIPNLKQIRLSVDGSVQDISAISRAPKLQRFTLSGGKLGSLAGVAPYLDLGNAKLRLSNVTLSKALEENLNELLTQYPETFSAYKTSFIE